MAVQVGSVELVDMVEDATVVEADWRKSEDVDKGHSQRWGHLLMSGQWSDVTFFVGHERKEFNVHKLVLRTGSKVFNDLFNANRKFIFEVPELEPYEFELLLQFLYTGKCTSNVEDGLALMNAATKYEVSDLVKECGKLVGGKLTEDNALPVYQQALKYKDADLMENALKCICRSGVNIIKSTQFLKLSVEELMSIVARDDLEILKEVDLFEAVVNWARAECQRQKSLETHKYLRSMLEKVIPLIRFPTIDPTDFAFKVFPTNILLTDELVSILLYFTVKKECR